MTASESKRALGFLYSHRRAILIGSLFAVVVLLLSFLSNALLQTWRDNVISANKRLTMVVAEQLRSSADPLLDSLYSTGLIDRAQSSTKAADSLDRRLKHLTDSLFAPLEGIEGGFFLGTFDEFFGYSYPTSPPPVPVYGPPPRSYNFIRDQAWRTIRQKTAIVELHQFDPAVFPLATEPISVGGDITVAAWSRIHIERDLPTLKLRQVSNIGAIVSFLGFVFAMLVSIHQKRRIQRMSLDFERVRSGQAEKIHEGGGTLGTIAKSINAMVRTIKADSYRREQLEHELHQKEKMASLGKVIAGVAHEVKTPLAIMKTRIQMWQQALRNREPGSNARDVFSSESLQMVVDEVDRLSGLVRSLLHFSKPQPALLEPTDVNQVLLQTIALSEGRSSVRNIRIKRDLANDLPRIPADRNALQQVFMNIIANSIEATSGSGTITIRTEADRKHDVCRVVISDDGPGIPGEIVKTIFDPFVTTKRKGFGLGLSISYEIIAAHGGSIRLESGKEHGAICTIEIPMTQGAPEQAK